MVVGAISVDSDEGCISISVDNQNIKLDYTIHEKEIACLLSKITGKTIIMQPKISGKLLGFSWPDYLIEGQRWELKDLFSGKSKYLLRDKVHKSAKQAENYVFDIIHSVVSEYELMNQAEALFVYYNTLHVKTIVIVKDGIIKRVLIRKESLPDPQVEKGQTL